MCGWVGGGGGGGSNRICVKSEMGTAIVIGVASGTVFDLGITYGTMFAMSGCSFGTVVGDGRGLWD